MSVHLKHVIPFSLNQFPVHTVMWLRKAVLTILRPCDMSKDSEGLGLQVGGATGPLRHLRILIVRFDHGLVDWRSTVHKRVFNRKCATPKQREKGKKQDQSFICVLWIWKHQIITNDYIIAVSIIIIKGQYLLTNFLTLCFLWRCAF